jgi:hypothetical protein
MVQRAWHTRSQRVPVHGLETRSSNQEGAKTHVTVMQVTHHVGRKLLKLPFEQTTTKG